MKAHIKVIITDDDNRYITSQEFTVPITNSEGYTPLEKMNLFKGKKLVTKKEGDE